MIGDKRDTIISNSWLMPWWDRHNVHGIQMIHWQMIYLIATFVFLIANHLFHSHMAFPTNCNFDMQTCHSYLTVPYCSLLLNIFQELKSFFHETKLEVKQIQSNWDEELRRLGENLVFVLIWVYNCGWKEKQFS